MKRLAIAAALLSLWGCGAPPDDLEEAASPLVIPDATALFRSNPGGVQTASGPMITYVGKDGRINVLKPVDPGRTWSKVVLEERTVGGTALHVGRDGKIHMAWIGTDNRLNMQRSTDGSVWTDKVTVGRQNHGIHQLPSMAIFGGQLHVFVSGGLPPPAGTYAVFRWTLKGDAWTGPEQMTEGLNVISVSVAQLDAEKLLVGMNVGVVGGMRFFTRSFNSAWIWTSEHSDMADSYGTLFVPPNLRKAVFVTRRGNGNIEAYQADGASFTRILQTDHFARGLPVGFSLTPSTLSFAHLGTDPDASLNFNTVSR